MVSKRTIYCTIFQLQFTYTLRVFTRQYTVEKNQLGEMLIKEIIEFELSEPGPPGCTCSPTNGYFHDQTKIFKEYLRMDCFFIYC